MTVTDPTDQPASDAGPVPRPGSRAARMRLPLARHVVEAVAVENGVCIRPLPVRRIDLATGETEVVPMPCGATLASKCPSCAERARKLRMAQCKAGWHLDDEPLPDPDPPTDEAKALVTLRADLETARAECADRADTSGVAEADDLISQVDAALEDLGVRGKPAPADRERPRRSRSTKRRQDAPDLPRLPVDRRTVGRKFTAPDGTVWRPSMFLTLTCDSYGRVNSDGTPVHAESYDYRRAARDAVHFPRLVDRFWQNLRRAVGWDVQYFAALEPQRRLAPHLHAAIRGTVPRVVLRQVAAATYHQVWWPHHDQPVYDRTRPSAWDHDQERYADPDSGQLLPTWDEAVDAIGSDDQPAHVVRFGAQVKADGVTANSDSVGRMIGYMTKYLTKSLDDCHTVDTDAQRAHVDRLADTLRYEPCSPTCANWLLFGVEPKNPKPGLSPGRCKGKAHKRQTLGFGGRRVLVSRRWSGKNLTDHRHDRADWIRAQLAALGHAPDPHSPGGQDHDPAHVAWQLLRPGDPAAPRREHLLLRAVADRHRWRSQLHGAPGAGPPEPASATVPLRDVA